MYVTCSPVNRFNKFPWYRQSRLGKQRGVMSNCRVDDSEDVDSSTRFLLAYSIFKQQDLSSSSFKNRISSQLPHWPNFISSRLSRRRLFRRLPKWSSHRVRSSAPSLQLSTWKNSSRATGGVRSQVGQKPRTYLRNIFPLSFLDSIDANRLCGCTSTLSRVHRSPKLFVSSLPFRKVLRKKYLILSIQCQSPGFIAIGWTAGRGIQGWNIFSFVSWWFFPLSVDSSNFPSAVKLLFAASHHYVHPIKTLLNPTQWAWKRKTKKDDAADGGSFLCSLLFPRPASSLPSRTSFFVQ